MSTRGCLEEEKKLKQVIWYDEGMALAIIEG